MTDKSKDMITNIKKGIKEMLDKKAIQDKGEEIVWGYVELRGLDEVTRNFKEEKVTIASEVDTLLTTVIENRIYYTKDGVDILTWSAGVFQTELTISHENTFIRETEESIAYYYGLRNVEITAFTTDLKQDTMLGCVNNRIALNNQFVFVYRWTKDNFYKPTVMVIPVGVFVSNTLAGEVDWQSFVVFDEGKIVST